MMSWFSKLRTQQGFFALGWTMSCWLGQIITNLGWSGLLDVWNYFDELLVKEVLVFILIWMVKYLEKVLLVNHMLNFDMLVQMVHYCILGQTNNECYYMVKVCIGDHFYL
jgi:hypothetical protein